MITIDIKKVISLYGEGKSLEDVAKIFDVSGATIGNKLRKNGYKLRSRKEGLKLAVKLGKRIKNISGEKYGRLTVIKFSKTDDNHDAVWECSCECGNIINIKAGAIKSGNTKSCGCQKIESSIKYNTTHNKSRSSIYSVWVNMKTRCFDEKFKHYGGRGISVCQRWLKFENFLSDMGEPAEGMTLDRKDNNKGYSVDNCRWATRKEQANNTRRNRFLTLNGESKTVSTWVNETGLTQSCIRHRINAGWNDEKILTTPKGKYEFKNK